VLFVVDKGALGQVFPENFGFPCQSSFHQFLYRRSATIPGGGGERKKKSWLMVFREIFEEQLQSPYMFWSLGQSSGAGAVINETGYVYI
jgi:hypothetical protein